MNAYLISFDRYAFAIGGQDGSEILSTVERYDPHSNAWILVAPLAIPLRFMTSISYRGKLYVFGEKPLTKSVTKHTGTKPRWNICQEITQYQLQKTSIIIILSLFEVP